MSHDSTGRLAVGPGTGLTGSCTPGARASDAYHVDLRRAETTKAWHEKWSFEELGPDSGFYEDYPVSEIGGAFA